jgi:predicted nucleic acid-binding protein
VGLILDTSVLIEAERTAGSVSDLILRLPAAGEVAIAAVTLMELSDGIARAKDDGTRVRRSRFVEGVREGIRVIPLDEEIAVAAGLLNGRLRKCGTTVGLADAMIAATAIRVGYGVATMNRRHFEAVDGLTVLDF